MMPPERDQADIGLLDQSIDCSDSPTNKDTARQEFKQEADINYMLSRFGITQPRGTPTYGITDDTLDLQQAIDSVTEAREGYNRLPQELRHKFPSMEAMLAAIENGSLEIKDEEAPPIPEPPPTTEQLVAAEVEKRLSAMRSTT